MEMPCPEEQGPLPKGQVPVTPQTESMESILRLACDLRTVGKGGSRRVFCSVARVRVQPFEETESLCVDIYVYLCN